ncbi:hypothetical protein [Bradyrhizobium macuxiense]|nr:hypothetical protein [Bradyrhizobium macuxiense]
MLVPEPLKHPLLAKTDREQLTRAAVEEIRLNTQRHGRDGRPVEIDGGRSMVKPIGNSVLSRLSGGSPARIQAQLIEQLGKFVSVIPIAAAKSRD